MALTIGLSTTSLEPRRNRGIFDGIGHYTAQLKQHLLATGYQVRSYAFQSLLKKRIAFKESMAFPQAFSLCSLLARLTYGRYPKFSPLVDLMHFTDFRVIPCRIPTVATLWDAIPMVHPHWLPSRLRYLAPYVYRFNARFADQIIVGASHAACDIEQHFHIHPDKISIIPWGVDDDWFEHVDERAMNVLLNQLHLQSGYFLTVGTLQPRKNINTLVSAYQRLPADIRRDRKLVIVGRYGWRCEALRDYLLSLNKTDDIVWLSNIASDADLRLLYKGAGVFIFPSLYEGFGLPVVEAFATGVPVICSNLTSLPEVSAGAALEINPYHVDDMVDAMVMFSQHAMMRKRYIQRGLARANELRWHHTLEKTCKLYAKMI